MKQKMTRKKRLELCYFNKETDRPAVYSRTAFPKNDASYDKLKSYLQKHTELKTQWWGGTGDEAAGHVESLIEPHSDDFKRHITILHTPKGDLRSSFLASTKGEPGMHETYYINSREDAEKYLALPVAENKDDVTSFFEAKTKIGDSGIASVNLGMNPGGYVVELCGSENFAMMSVTDRDVLHRLCERRMKIIDQRVKYLLTQTVGPFFSMLGEEYIVPPLHGLADFNDFNVKYDKPIIDLIHEANGRVHIHSHGSIKSVFQGFIDMGADVLHPFEPPPQGDILANEAKKLARNVMCLEGNIQINRMYEATADEIKSETEKLIADVFDDSKGLIVSPTASPYIRGKGQVCFNQYKAMIDTVLQWKS